MDIIGNLVPHTSERKSSIFDSGKRISPDVNKMTDHLIVAMNSPGHISAAKFLDFSKHQFNKNLSIGHSQMIGVMKKRIKEERPITRNLNTIDQMQNEPLLVIEGETPPTDNLASYPRNIKI